MSRPDRLTRFQRDLAREFFARESRFFLSGGAALVGFHLGHRTTLDLDLFVTENLLEEGERALLEAADALGATVEGVTTSPGFRRRLVRRRDESIVVDLVHERVEQGYPEKLLLEGMRVDPPEEILANKLCTLLSRAEIRDLVDVRALEQASYELGDALALAARKDTGLTPAQLGWVLSQIEIPDDADLPGGVAAAELREYMTDLSSRLARLAWPG